MRAEQAALYKIRIISIAVAMILLSISVVWGSGALHRFSYSKLTPVALEIVVDSALEQQLFVDYDYGYGFIREHRQSFSLQVADSQLIELSMSGWKKLRRLRVRVENADSTQLQSVLFSNSTDAIERIGPWVNQSGDLTILLSIDDLQGVLNVE
jgi:hypothetical protein